MPSPHRTLLALACCLPATAALAHPHAWIDLESRLTFDAGGQVTALEVDWVFDELYTAFIAEEFVASGAAPSDYLRDVAAENLANLREHDYFVDLRLAGERLALGDVSRFETGLRGERLWLNFTLPLVEPVRPDEAGLTLQVYDPTYYVEILYAEGWEPVLDAGAAAGCSAEVQPPDPDPQMVALAYALDASQTGGDGLGVHFAETLRVRCP